MRYSGAQTIFPCKEYEEVNIPFSLLMDSAGRLDLYTETSSKGYFDIDFRQGQLSLRSKGFVGLIPVSDKVAINVEPRAPIANLLYMIWRAGMRLNTISDFIRGYQEHPGRIDNPEELYVSTFLSALSDIQKVGPLKRYCRRTSDIQRRGRLLFAETISRFYSSGIRHRQSFEFFELTIDNRENQILKHITERLLSRFLSSESMQARAVARRLRLMLQLFSGVSSESVNNDLVAREAISLIRGLPGTHRFYEPALWLSYLMATKSGVRMERIGRAKFESLIIDVSDVFEQYVRSILRGSDGMFNGCTVLDGNIHQVPLFLNSRQYPTQPDYYFRRQRINVGVADAKYKPNVATEDRYSLITYCEALGVKKCAFICPRFSDEQQSLLQGTTQGGIEVHVIRIDLNASDLASEEIKFKGLVAASLGL